MVVHNDTSALWCVPCCNWRRGAIQPTLDWSTHSWTPRCVSFLTLRPTPLPWLPVLANIESSALRRKAATDMQTGGESQCSWELATTPRYISNPPQLRLQSRKPLWHESEPIDINSQWRESWKSASVVSAHLVDDPTVRHPGFALPRQQWSLLNCFRTAQGHHSALDKVTAVLVGRNGISQTPTSVPVVRPKRCHTLSNPAHWQDYTVACPNYALQLMILLLGWPVMALKCIRNNNWRWQNRHFICDDLLHLLTWTQPDKDCLCRVQM